MKIKEIGGEFALIKRLADIIQVEATDVIIGIGDDAAVLRTAPEPAPYLLVTTDMLIEERHFIRSRASAEQIGIKAVECNASDIAAMGGVPTWLFVSLSLTADISVEWVEGLYQGMAESCHRYGIVIAGGDTTQGLVNTINISLLGHVSDQNLCLRSQALPGDLLIVTGTLGASAAALALLDHGEQPGNYLIKKHLTPSCRLDAAVRIAPFAHAMIDISDGLGSEVHHICNQSKVGAEIKASAIPLHADVKAAGRKLRIDPTSFALSGGEDFELLFSLAPCNLHRLAQTGLTCYTVGRITDQAKECVLILADGSSELLPGGYDHFSKLNT